MRRMQPSRRTPSQTPHPKITHTNHNKTPPHTKPHLSQQNTPPHNKHTPFSTALKKLVATGEPITSMHASCVEEAQMVMFHTVKEVLARTGIRAQEVRVRARACVSVFVCVCVCVVCGLPRLMRVQLVHARRAVGLFCVPALETRRTTVLAKKTHTLRSTSSSRPAPCLRRRRRSRR